VSDDDPSNVGVYAQAGSRFGLSTLWLFLVTAPLMAAVQETCARVALQTSVGLGATLGRKFPRKLVGLLLLALVVGNCITLGADLSAVAAGIGLLLPFRVPILWLVLPVALVLLLMQLQLTYEMIAKTFKYVTVALLAYVVRAVLRPGPGRLLAATFVPHLQLSNDFAMIIVAVLGTTLSPYVFFWQASLVVHERRLEGKTTEEPRRGASFGKLVRTRADLLVGVVVAQLVMYCLVVSTALVLNAHGKHDAQSASQAAEA
jgi:NRAMP (natural resistance-associated macrophage protein)-like metal ion transporter